MGGHELALVEDLDGTRRQAHVDTLADEAVRHGVVRALDLDVVVGMHLGSAPLAELVAARGQRLEHRGVELREA